MARLKNGLAFLSTGLVVGAGVALTIKKFGPDLERNLRPLAKKGLKAGYLFVEKSKESLAYLGEAIEDLVAEARAEIQEHFASAEPAHAEGEEGTEEHEGAGLGHARADESGTRAGATTAAKDMPPMAERMDLQ